MDIGVADENARHIGDGVPAAVFEIANADTEIGSAQAGCAERIVHEGIVAEVKRVGDGG